MIGAGPAAASGVGDQNKFVYSESNKSCAAGGNTILVFSRQSDGTLVQQASVPTGGCGLAAEPPFFFPIVDSQGALTLSDGGNLLFAVNAGSNSISSFRVTPGGLALVDVEPSGGVDPISVSSHGNVLYTVNEVSGNIYGYHVDGGGSLTPIAGSSQSLNPPGAAGVAAQVGISPNGQVVTVTQRCFSACPTNPLGLINTFKLGPDDAAGPVQTTPSSGDIPFGFAYRNSSHLIVTNVGTVVTPANTPPNPADPAQFNGSASSYDQSNSGALTPTGTVPADGRGTCWIAITNDGKFAYVTNSLSGSIPPFSNLGSGTNAITIYSIASDGTLTFAGHANSGPLFSTDVALTRDNKFLYVVVDTLNMTPVPDLSYIETFSVNKDGSLTFVGTTAHNLPGGLSGVVAN